MSRARSMAVAAALLALAARCSDAGDGGADGAIDAKVADTEVADTEGKEAAVDASSDSNADAINDAAIDSAGDTTAIADAMHDVVIADAALDLTASDSSADLSVVDLMPLLDGIFPPPPDGLPDGTTSDGPLLGCGPVPFEGCCRAEVLYYCDASGLLQSVDCSASLKCGWDAFYNLYDCGTDGAADTTIPKTCPF